MNKLPNGWSGGIFAGRITLPLGLSIFAFNVIRFPHDSFDVVWLLLIVAPTFALALFLFTMPAQLVVNGQVVSFRRWTTWRTISVDEISIVKRAISAIGLMRLESGERIFFVIEDKNRKLFSLRTGDR
jgi:hypothetical protein